MSGGAADLLQQCVWQLPGQGTPGSGPHSSGRTHRRSRSSADVSAPEQALSATSARHGGSALVLTCIRRLWGSNPSGAAEADLGSDAVILVLSQEGQAILDTQLLEGVWHAFCDASQHWLQGHPCALPCFSALTVTGTAGPRPSQHLVSMPCSGVGASPGVCAIFLAHCDSFSSSWVKRNLGILLKVGTKGN